uniref:FLYWCH-type domain-containing protein n=1 Tax=Anopheles albimanus TaxID=7167 RepID=A0A182FXA6_ANOAL
MVIDTHAIVYWGIAPRTVVYSINHWDVVLVHSPILIRKTSELLTMRTIIRQRWNDDKAERYATC